MHREPVLFHLPSISASRTCIVSFCLDICIREPVLFHLPRCYSHYREPVLFHLPHHLRREPVLFHLPRYLRARRKTCNVSHFASISASKTCIVFHLPRYCVENLYCFICLDICIYV
ncbi:hypothetical protein CEXT_32071 [Caerostris extrusa]|uniref:Uncharacterized protein n=1 Tax=Caerostris extrusa TaxID=172846 RepID=A0AAV4VGY4_CAEEX|nr:hypothetical protein CEXT_32071 [Caerostris extrusa]